MTWYEWVFTIMGAITLICYLSVKVGQALNEFNKTPKV